MPRSFRFGPPEPRRDALLHRRRLLRALLGRWEHRVTLVVGGPGLGKTTLLAQAVVENRLDPRGLDIWIGVEPYDSDSSALAQAVRTALATADDPAGPVTVDASSADLVAVAEMVWQRSPTEVCIVFDDAHLIGPSSSGARWLGELVESLPANGHLLFACRSDPAFPLARLEGSGAVMRLGEADLRMSTDELQDFAARRQIDPQSLAGSGGWPAIVELTAVAEKRRSGSYLWEEVLEPVGSIRRHLLAIVSDLGGADDRLASAAAGAPVALAGALADIPLVAVGSDGWYVPHALWQSAPGIVLDPDERAAVRRRAVSDLVDRGRIDQAFTLAAEAGLWDVVPTVLRAACLESERLNPAQLERCLSASPASVRASPAGQLATALRLAFTQPAAAIEPLRTAADECRAMGDVEAELTALAQLGRLAWGRQDLGSIGGEVASRIAAIEATGHQTAHSLAGFIRALVADLGGDDKTVLAELDSIEPGVLDPVWTAMAVWLRGGVRLDQGDAEAVAEMIGTIPATDPAIVAILGGLRARVLWALGQLDQALVEIPALLDAVRDAGIASLHAQGLTNASLAMSFTGNRAQARECLVEASAAATEPIGGASSRAALANASLLLAEGDEDAAAAALRDTIDARGGPERSADRRAWRHVLSLSYILVPETRPYWDAAALRGHFVIARTVASALVAARDKHGEERIWNLDLSNLGRIRAALHYRHAAELAVHLAAAGRSEGPALLDTLGPPGRQAVHQLADTRSTQARHAKGLLTTTPAPPPLTTHLAVLGPLVMSRGRESDRHEVVDPDLRRPRVKALLAYLVGHRRTHRGAIAAALWPDLDDRSASNNLGVTLSYLLHALEPWRRAGEPPYLVRLDGQRVELVTGTYLHVDVDDFDAHLAAATQAEAEGNPSVALDHDLAASDLYRGDLLVDVPEADWLDLERAHYRTRYVTILDRAAQLLVGRGDIEQAESLAKRVLNADPWNEDAYAVLASTALTRGNRSEARNTLERCFAALTELGANPSETTRHLSRRCGLASASA